MAIALALAVGDVKAQDPPVEESAHDAFEAAWRLQGVARFDEALERYGDAVDAAIGEGHPLTYYRIALGGLLLRLGQDEEAVGEFTAYLAAPGGPRSEEPSSWNDTGANALLGLAGLDVRAGRWDAARSHLEEALALLDPGDEFRPAVEVAIASLDDLAALDAGAASPSTARRIAVRRWELALANPEDVWSSRYPVGAAPLAAELASLLLAGGRAADAAEVLGSVPGYQFAGDCAAVAVRLLSLADYFDSGADADPVIAAATYDSAASLPPHVLAAADRPAGTLRRPSDPASVHERWVHALLRLEPLTGPATARAAAMDAVAAWRAVTAGEPGEARERASSATDASETCPGSARHQYFFPDDVRDVWVPRASTLDLLAAGSTDRRPAELGRLWLEHGSLTDSLAVSGEGAVVWMTGADTLLTWLVLPTGEVELDRAPVGAAALAAASDAVAAGPATPADLGRVLLPDRLRRLLPPAGRFVVSVPPALASVPIHALPTGDGRTLGERFMVVTVETVRGYLATEEWQAQKSARAAADTERGARSRSVVGPGAGTDTEATEPEQAGAPEIDEERLAATFGGTATVLPMTQVLGDSATAALLLEWLESRLEPSARPPAAAGVLQDSAEARLAAGDSAGAARRYEMAAYLRAGAAPGVAAGNLRLAADAWISVGDSLRAGRALRSASLWLDDAGFAWDALDLQTGTAPQEMVATLLALEHLLRLERPAQADSALLLACHLGCGLATDDPASLWVELQREIEADPRGARRFRGVRSAVRGLIGVALEEQQESRIPGFPSYLFRPEFALGAAAGSARAAGDAAREATLLHALGALLRDPPILSGRATWSSDPDSALVVLRRARELRRAVGDRTGEARSLSLAATVHLRRDSIDAAERALDAAEEVLAAAVRDDHAEAPAVARRRRAMVAAARGDDAAAERLLGEAVSLRPDPDGAAAAFDRHWVARAFLDAGDAPRALDGARAAYAVLRAEAPPELAARTEELLAEAHALAGRPDSAVHWLEASLDAWQRLDWPTRQANTLAAMAEHRLEAGRLEEAEALFERALHAARERRDHLAVASGPPLTLGPSDPVAARILNGIGLLLFAQDRWAEARTLFIAAEGVAPFDHPERWAAERNRTLAVLAADGARAADRAAESALRQVRWAVSDTDAARPARPPYRTLTLGWAQLHAAAAAARFGALGEVRRQLELATPLLEEAGHAPSLQRAQGLHGWLFLQLGRADSAAVYFERAGPIGQEYASIVGEAFEAAGADPHTLLRRRVREAEPADALALLATLLEESRDAGDRLAEARVLEALGYFNLVLRGPADAVAATAYHDSAAVALMDVDLAGMDDWHQVQLREQFTRLQRESAAAWLARSSELGPATAAAGALAAAERGRGRAFETLVRARSGGQGFSPDGPWAALRYDDAWLPEIGASLLRFQQDWIARARSPNAVLSYLPAADTLFVWLHLPTGELFVERVAVAADSLAMLVSHARSAMGVDGTGNRDLGELEDNPLAALLRQDERAVPPVDRALTALGEVLIPQRLRVLLPRYRIELLVIPGGPVAAVPFAALPLDNGAPLSERFAVRYAPSLASLNVIGGVLTGGESLPASPRARHPNPDSLIEARQAWLRRSVVVGNPDMPEVALPDGRARRLDRLPGAEREARDVAALLGTEPLTGAAANLGGIRTRLEDATVVHFATHGFAYADEGRVGDSFIALAPSSEHDGVLTVDEMLAIPDLRLGSAELVVLSACQTGLGQLTESEGTLGLQRAFLAVGARTLLVSLWSVSDEATALLLRSFYTHWLDGESSPGKSEALRMAQEELRSVPRYAHPRYWSAFQLVGAP